jgi:hypothetical protein
VVIASLGITVVANDVLMYALDPSCLSIEEKKAAAGQPKYYNNIGGPDMYDYEFVASQFVTYNISKVPTGGAQKSCQEEDTTIKKKWQNDIRS